MPDSPYERRVTNRHGEEPKSLRNVKSDGDPTFEDKAKRYEGEALKAGAELTELQEADGDPEIIAFLEDVVAKNQEWANTARHLHRAGLKPSHFTTPHQ